MAIIKTTGYHPDDFRAYPLCPELKNIIDDIAKQILSDHQLFTNIKQINFNSMECKIYCGNNTYYENNANPLLRQRKNSNNKMCGEHTDFDFYDDGHQKERDTALATHPVFTFTIGSDREYTYTLYRKHATRKNATWEKLLQTQRK